MQTREELLRTKRAYNLAHREKARNYRRVRKEHIRIVARRYRATHLDRERKRERVWTAAHRELRRTCLAAWRLAHPDYARNYRETHRAQRSIYDKQWRIAHPELTHARYRREARNRVSNMAASYIRNLLSQGTDISPSEWPAKLIETKRRLLKLRRMIHAIERQNANSPVAVRAHDLG